MADLEKGNEKTIICLLLMLLPTIKKICLEIIEPSHMRYDATLDRIARPRDTDALQGLLCIQHWYGRRLLKRHVKGRVSCIKFLLRRSSQLEVDI